MTNPDDWVLAYSLIKNSVVQIERTSNEDVLHLTNTNRNKLSITSPISNIHIDDMPRVRGPKSTRFTCPICGLITVSMERLQRHVNQHGQKLRLETYKPERKVSSLVCEKCKATFSSAYALRKHQRVHTRGLFICKYQKLIFCLFVHFYR
jgi:transcription elongation factor Elf1